MCVYVCVCICACVCVSYGVMVWLSEVERENDRENWGNKNRPFGNIHLRERLSHTNIERENLL